MMKFNSPICVFVLLAGSMAGAQVASHAPTVIKRAPAANQALPVQNSATQPVARVNGSVLTEADLIREEYTIFPYARQHGGMPKAMESQIRQGAMQMIIFEELVYQQALREKMTVPETKLKLAESEFRKQFATPQEFNALYQSEFHGSQKLLREKIRRSLLIDAFLMREVERKSIVTPAEARAYYDKNQAQFARPESYTFQTISILPPEKATAAQMQEGRQRAEKAWQQAKATRTAEQFGLLAEKISDDDYRVMMGQHKPVPASELAPQVVKALKSMKPGDMSGLIQMDQAYTIVRLGQHAPAGVVKFDDVKAQLTRELEKRKRDQIQSALNKKLRQNAKIEVL